MQPQIHDRCIDLNMMIEAAECITDRSVSSIQLNSVWNWSTNVQFQSIWSTVPKRLTSIASFWLQFFWQCHIKITVLILHHALQTMEGMKMVKSSSLLHMVYPSWKMCYVSQVQQPLFTEAYIKWKRPSYVWPGIRSGTVQLAKGC